MFGHGTPADRAAAQRRSREVRRQTRRMERAGIFLLPWAPGAGWPPKLRYPTRWYYHSNLQCTHSGDKAESFNIEAERFDHYSRTWASWQHSTAFIVVTETEVSMFSSRARGETAISGRHDRSKRAEIERRMCRANDAWFRSRTRSEAASEAGRFFGGPLGTSKWKGLSVPKRTRPLKEGCAVVIGAPHGPAELVTFR